MEAEELNKLRAGFARFTDEQKYEIVKLLELTGFIKSKDELLSQYEDVRKDIKGIANNLKIINEYNSNLQNQTNTIKDTMRRGEGLFENTTKEIIKTSEYIKNKTSSSGRIQLLIGVVLGICINLPYGLMNTVFFSTYLWIDFAVIIALSVAIGFALSKIKSR